MKKLERNYETLLRITNAVSHRILERMMEAQKREFTRWTPFEGVPVSVTWSELGEREMPPVVS